MSYDEVIILLNKQYGEVTDNYYKEKSYNKFLNGEIKSISKGKFSKTKEGLYCHHVFENKYDNLSNANFISHYKYPFDYQKKENLGYSDLFEHLILHTLIAKESNGIHGLAGYFAFILPNVEEWYINEIDPGLEWQKNCKEKAYLSKEYVQKILLEIDNKINITDMYKLYKKELYEKR
ncbi:hypothetical protein RM616_06830 [Mammaliicoccus sciuri]|uniref:hypothetical protein n=1 Tax=Mammaliicoccus sciuri TaxID=1296 RepID=UPI002887157C|nr:hypothetical protein [Mammaliicoccus sciuri]MDT0669294.1 hypothetical protein [Mammaliicoccus sciuri]